MRLTHKGHRVTLQGVKDFNGPSSQIPPKKLQGLLRNGMISYCIEVSCSPKQMVTDNTIYSLEDSANTNVPPVVLQLLQNYEYLFATPTSLPPHRAADHVISLIPGAQPVKVRPYRYSPIQKGEIEKQL